MAIIPRDQLLKKARNTKHDSNWTAFKAKRKEVKSSLKAAESDFVQSRFEEFKGRSGEIWKVIRNFIPTARSTSDTLFFTKDN